jgi:hypothetical protein
MAVLRLQNGREVERSEETASGSRMQVVCSGHPTDLAFQNRQDGQTPNIMHGARLGRRRQHQSRMRLCAQESCLCVCVCGGTQSLQCTVRGTMDALVSDPCSGWLAFRLAKIA